jgi:hypothetical protein
MLTANVVMRSIKRALGVTEKSLCRICSHQPPRLIVACVFFDAVIDGIMRCEVLARFPIGWQLIGILDEQIERRAALVSDPGLPL